VYETDKSKYPGLSDKERKQRVQKIHDFGERLDRLYRDLQKAEGDTKGPDIETGVNRERNEDDGEYEHTQGKTNQELLLQQRQHLDN